MRIFTSSRALFAFGFVVLVATNIFVFAGVVSNRSGTPEALLTLTERELQLAYQPQKENSGLALQLVWRALGKDDNIYNYSGRGNPGWFNADKLRELGFKIDDTISLKENGNSNRQSISKEIFIVLEYNGELYREAVQRAEKAHAKEEGLFKVNNDDKRLRDNYEGAEKRLKLECTATSRLFAIDAGLDPERLRDKYNDRTRFIITKGVVRPNYNYDNKKKEVAGYISKLSVETIHVPLEHRKILDNISAQNKTKRNELPPRYDVNLAYGSRLEPWIVSVHSLND